MSPDLARFPTPLIRATELAAWLPQVVLFDARFDLARPDAGAAAFAQGHIPGARHLHLDHDLSAGPASTGAASALSGGRHPLPGAAQAAATFGRFGVQPGVPVVIC
ncbi:MAG: sulfurtransferase, partial [Leptothrix sp. (in: b-proteobacteria)]